MKEKRQPGIPRPSLRRLPFYYRRLLLATQAEQAFISSAELGESAGVSADQVRKDLSYLSLYGRAGVGYDTRQMAKYLEEFLGLANNKEAVLVGVGNLGRALVLFPGFSRYGLQIVALFDNDPHKVGQIVGDREILPLEKLTDLSRRLHIRIGIITVPAESAQTVADAMVEGGIEAIWNFAPYRLKVPEKVLVQNEDLAAELATLSHHITRQAHKS
jgi:redox-sensing transcriptional repressor